MDWTQLLLWLAGFFVLALTGILDAILQALFRLLGLGPAWQRLGKWTLTARKAASHQLEKNRSRLEGLWLSITGWNPLEDDTED